MDHDLIIVGASFAGLVCARAAALRGLNVLVVEAKPDPGARIHTTGILVKEAAEELDVPAHLIRIVHGVRLYSPNLRSVDLYSPGYYFLTTRTADLMRWLADEARRAGAEIRCSTRFTGAETTSEAIRLHGLGLTCRYLIGADGARSAVATNFALARNRRFLTGLEAEYSTVDGLDEELLHCFLDSQIAPGYLSWIAPAPDVVQVGLATNGSTKPSLDRFRAHVSGLFGFDPGRIVERRSGVIPCGGVVRPFANERVMLIGDAAGVVSPLTAGGIQLAFRHGRRAGQLAADYLLRHGPRPDLVLERELPNFTTKRLLRRALDLAPPNWMYDLALTTAPMQAFARRIYFANRYSRDLSPEEFEARVRTGTGEDVVTFEAARQK